MKEKGFELPSLDSYETSSVGGRAVAHHTDGTSASRSLQARAPRGSARSIGALALEPTLGVDRRGRIFYAAVAPLTLAEDSVSLGLQGVVRGSTDGGRTWKDVSPRLGSLRRHSFTQDPMLYVDERTGRVFTSDLQADLCGLFSFTDDGGF